MTIDPSCAICGATYPTPSRLRNHMRQHHPGVFITRPVLPPTSPDPPPPAPSTAELLTAIDQDPDPLEQLHRRQLVLEAALHELVVAIDRYSIGVDAWDTLIEITTRVRQLAGIPAP